MSNTLNRLSAVLSNKQRSIVKIVQVNTDGTTTVEHSDSSQSTVLGDSVANGSAYIEDGRIVGAAPDLPYSELEV
ncbi:hypothetical protein N473_26415 [Pseudoalteromonas luteoviolacea CPMOR-1]|uniref:Uncharacterized protein n=1 Tax=Pseudoalteromonas luteoviolacea CPMOR-1 TaxID=1365248 RepID=A0A167HRI8_9GAMM|nr:hypothetical protein [Pseudoalteromonas luteoviolacea]KZN58445.1 hypothetical protein N473_26415 [Pseudoalteromonas luteoviolacea CPMOR-1]